jgi:hypothetical protein
MGRVSTHLKKFHEHSQAHHTELAACYKDAVSAFGKNKDGSDTLRDALDKIAATHEAAAAYHKEAMAECSKAIEAGDVQKTSMEPEPLPAGLSRVAPERTNIRMVPRTGAPLMPVEKNAGKIGGIDFLGLKEMDEL